MAEPKGWAKCPEIGDLVAGMKYFYLFVFFFVLNRKFYTIFFLNTIDNFVPFKVPFGPSFTPEYVIRKFRQNNVFVVHID